MINFTSSTGSLARRSAAPPRSPWRECARPVVAAAVLLFLPGVALQATETSSLDERVTFAKDVAPIFFNHCAQCHRPGEVAPMSLLSYQEARPWAKSIRRAVEERIMPPWGAAPEYGSWKNDISLTDAEIRTIVRWVDLGAPEGDAALLPAVPQFAEGWKLGEPDYVIELPEVVVPAGGEDVFPDVWVDVDLPDERWVSAIEFMPGDRRAAHHMLVTYSSGGKGSAGRGEFKTGAGNGGSGIFAVWTAGMQPNVFEPGMGRLLRPGLRLLINGHYHPFGEATVDRTRVGLHFGEGPLRKEVSTLTAVNTGIRIPPGEPDYRATAVHLFDSDSRIVSFSPHMHVRGKAMKYELFTPDGGSQVLLDVPRYDYNWQWLYYPKEDVRVPAGSKLVVTAAWDNSAGNPSNPDPSQEIHYRGNTFNEMFVGFFEVVEEQGVYATIPEPREKITRLLADHAAADSYLLGGFLPLGLYVPRAGLGWVYAVQGNTTTSISLDDIRWEGDRVVVHTVFPTPDADGIESLIEGKVDADGHFQGTLYYGPEDAGDKRLKLPIGGRRLGAPGGVASSGSP